MTDTIRPHHAASVWANNQILFAELPNPDGRLGEEDSNLVAALLRLNTPVANAAAERLTQLALRSRSHQLRLPLNVFGIRQLLDTLQARNENSSLGELGDITQNQADKRIKEMKRLAAGYTGPIKKPLPKVPVTPELAISIRSIIRKFITT